MRDGLPIDAAEQREEGRSPADDVKNREGEGKPRLFPKRHRRDAAAFGDKNIDGGENILQVPRSDGGKDGQQRRRDRAERLTERKPQDEREQKL